MPSLSSRVAARRAPGRRALAALAVSLVLLFAAPAAAQAYWGAIAVNPETGRYGVSYDYATVAGAKHRARVECGRGACRVAVWVRNGYAALVQKSNGAYVAGAGRTERIAFRVARHRAHEQSAHTVASVYSG
ncbi:MAG: DUF4189 domain-containing protein [Solirubrobacterales bacterium]